MDIAMKVLFFSDVHGSPESLELLQKRIDSLQPAQLVVLGDLLYHGPRNPLRPDYAPRRVAEWFNARRNSIIAVRGNCDSEVDQMMIEFPIMAEYAVLFDGERRFFLTHGHHWNPATPPPLAAGNVLVSGHTHLPMLERGPDGVIFFNPGSISLPKGGNLPSFGWYDGETLRILELSTGKEMKRLALREGSAAQ